MIIKHVGIINSKNTKDEEHVVPDAEINDVHIDVDRDDAEEECIVADAENDVLHAY